MKAVIMCGGSGTRLWPLSRKSSPKQFVPLFGGKSLFELTIERHLDLVDEFIIVVNDKQLPLCKKQIPKILSDKCKFIIEPVGRNTAPAITLAALIAKGEDLLILPSDHLIKNHSQYIKNIEEAQKMSENSDLVTFGITPSYPEIGYGYIEARGNEVLSFKEKPDLETAKAYLLQGNYYWNSGMFFFNSSVYLSELEKFNNEIIGKSKIAIEKASKDQNIFRISLDDMMGIPSDSIDYAVMEKSKKVKVIPSTFTWSDLGSFDSLYEEFEKDSCGNSVTENHISLNSNNNLIMSQKRLIATFEVDNLIIVDTPDALLVGKRGDGQKVKDLLEKVREKSPFLLD